MLSGNTHSRVFNGNGKRPTTQNSRTAIAIVIIAVSGVANCARGRHREKKTERNGILRTLPFMNVQSEPAFVLNSQCM